MAVHFVGFKGDEYTTAVQVWGKPDFFHRFWDVRAKQEVVEGDVAVFARGQYSDQPKVHSFNDSEVF